MATTTESHGLVAHYKRLLTKGGSPAQETVESGEMYATRTPDFSSHAAKERLETARDALYRIIEDYLDGDRSLRSLADKIIHQGGEGLRMLDDENEAGLRPGSPALEGLEVIVRTDGSRPSFLIREGRIDMNSSPIGSWGRRLDDSASALDDAIPCVGRIDIPGGGFGTGFLIQDDLILTNRHVLQIAARQDDRGRWRFAPGAAIDFGHEYRGWESRNRRLLKNVVFAGSRSISFDSIDHQKLDLALIELEPGDRASAPTRVFGLDVTPAWVLPDAVVYTIGYPGPPQSGLYPPTLLEQLFRATYGCKRLAPGEILTSQSSTARWTLAHDATTLGGNSGSIVVRAGAEGLAAGLHYGGRTTEPRENWGHVLEQVLDANDGASTRSLREILSARGVTFTNAAAPATDVSGNGHSPQPNGDDAYHDGPSGSGVDRPIGNGRQSGSGRDWRNGITLQSMQRLNGVHVGSSEAAELEAAGDGVTNAASFAGRGGYNPDAIPNWRIPLPTPAGDMRRLRRGGNGVELKYEHFSVIMSASRRMAMLTACNIDGAASRRVPRIRNWSYDGRLDQEDQWGNELYRNNDVDRGHMVRREDPVWGSVGVAKQANRDTFHYTNSCPQMAGVNQVTWLGLENYILDHVREDNMKVSVFTGPYFTPQDFPYRGALIPKAFWKIVAFLTDDGRPSATAYQVSQARELQELEFVFAGYKTFQVSIQSVMDATRIDFRALIPFDGFSQHERVHGVTLKERIDSLDQIRV